MAIVFTMSTCLPAAMGEQAQRAVFGVRCGDVHHVQCGIGHELLVRPERSVDPVARRELGWPLERARPDRRHPLVGVGQNRCGEGHQRSLREPAPPHRNNGPLEAEERAPPEASSQTPKDLRSRFALTARRRIARRSHRQCRLGWAADKVRRAISSWLFSCGSGSCSKVGSMPILRYLPASCASAIIARPVFVASGSSPITIRDSVMAASKSQLTVRSASMTVDRLRPLRRRCASSTRPAHHRRAADRAHRCTPG